MCIVCIIKRGDMILTAREVEKILLKDGWYCVAQKGSHKQYRHSFKPGKITIPFHKGKTLHPRTTNSILRDAGLKDWNYEEELQ